MAEMFHLKANPKHKIWNEFERQTQVINDHPYRVIPPAQDAITSAAVAGLATEELQRLGDVRALVGQLYEALNVEEHQAQQGRNTRLLKKTKLCI